LIIIADVFALELSLYRLFCSLADCCKAIFLTCSTFELLQRKSPLLLVFSWTINWLLG
jgi:hypothetical protein